ncbi:hypothetical protein GCM10011611_41610 [Aliidongia dinghuensis]|uniref:Uncharacterized protein n=1 Tax=Aliidongia dinghuensis TaxID=1867774 RepID=A0A8J2YXX9_9PROT|nr:hypothetical protein GCM10011611_41610 [Aliidongia dinghuensis]
MGVPPSVRPMAGRATAAPVKVSGIAAAARHTARRMSAFLAALGIVVSVMKSVEPGMRGRQMEATGVAPPLVAERR